MWMFDNEHIIGNGSFGVVYQATVRATQKEVAIKKVLQDKRFKNRELQIMKMLDHTNVTTLLHYFYTEGDKAEETYLNLVMDFIPQTVYGMSRQYAKAKKAFPTLFMKLYTYQLCRSLAYIHSLGVCHRDIKPQNLLVHPETHMLKLCDFGSAKILVKGEPNVSYICSRYYRAPELIFGARTTHAALMCGLPAACWRSSCSECRCSLGSRELTSSWRSSRCSARPRSTRSNQ